MKTMRNVIIGFLAAIAIPASGSLISRIYTFQDGQVLTASQLNSEFNNVVNGVNSIDNANISDSANINPTKISSSIAGSGLSRDSGTGYISVNPDGVGLEISGDTIQIKDLGVTTAKIAATSVTAAKLATDSVETTKIKDLNVTAGKLATDSVETAKIKDGAVTQVKLGSANVQTSSVECSNATVSTMKTWVDVPNMSVTITTYGRPVWVGFVPVYTGGTTVVDPGSLPLLNSGTNMVYTRFTIDGTGFGSIVNAPTGYTNQSIITQTVIAAAAGSHTFKAQVTTDGGGTTVTCSKMYLVAYEL